MGDLFSSTDDSSQQFQLAENAATRELIAKGVKQARGDILDLFPGGLDARNQTINQALGILGQTIPQQLSVTQQGNVGAQGALLSGLPQIQNAILGQQVDLSGLQPQTLNFDPSFSQQTLPDFQTVEQLLAPPPVAPPGPGNFRGGRFGGLGGPFNRFNNFPTVG